MKKIDLRVPDLYVHRVIDIPFELLAAQGRRKYIIDLDNTLLTRDRDVPEPDTEAAIHYAQDEGWITGLTFVSNVVTPRVWIVLGRSRVERVRKVASRFDALALACIWPVLKPKPAAFLKPMCWMRVRPEDTVVVGDQISKDIVGGNRVGAFTILVDPLGKDFIGTALMRLLKGEHKIRARLRAERP